MATIRFNISTSTREALARYRDSASVEDAYNVADCLCTDDDFNQSASAATRTHCSACGHLNPDHYTGCTRGDRSIYPGSSSQRSASHDY